MKQFLIFLKNHPLITAVLAVVFSLVSLKSIPQEGNWQVLIMRLLLCGSMSFFLYLISGEKTLSMYANNTGFALKAGAGFWIFAAPLGILHLLIADGEKFENVPLEMFILFLSMIFIGLFEELAFRAIINDAVMRVFRTHRTVFLLSALCCSIAFGAGHVVGVSLTTPLMWLQASLKILSSGLFGLALLFIYWKTRNVWACGIVHGIYDFILSIPDGIYKSTGRHISYIVEGEAGKASCIAYGVQSAITLIILWFIWRKTIKGTDMDELRENW